MNIIDEARKVLSIEADAIRALSERLDSGFIDAVDIIYGCRGRVVVTGMGKSGIIGKKIAATMASTGTPAFYLHPAEASHGDLGMVTENDVVVALSNSGETDEIIALIPFFKRFGLKLISMTGNPQSTLSKSSDANIDVSVSGEACPMGLAPTTSTTAALAMGDALSVALLLKRGFKEEDFASFHPKGSLGKKLLIKVSDLMHKGDAIPAIELGASMTQAVVQMSSKRLGMTTVLTPEGALAGIITDGDLRRGIERFGQRVFDMLAQEVMTKGPKTIQSGELAVTALSIMQRMSITALVVIDAGGRPAGVIHLHDILKEGIV